MAWHIVSMLLFLSFNLLAADFPCIHGSLNKPLNPGAVKLSKDIVLIVQPGFYQKFLMAEGLVIKGSKNVSDSALRKASETLNKMLSKRADIRKNLIAKKADIVIIAPAENYCSFPETLTLAGTKTFDGRDFCSICGAGGNEGRPITAICEDNLLQTDKDPYNRTEDILTHELAHTIHSLGMDEGTKRRLVALYSTAKVNNIFTKNKKGEATYVMANDEEFFACLTAVWFGVHNPESPAFSADLINRNSIKEKFPMMYNFLAEIYPE